MSVSCLDANFKCGDGSETHNPFMLGERRNPANEARLHSFHAGRAVREMTRALALPESQARALLRAAEKERGIVEVKIGKAVVRLIPESLAQAERPIAKEEDIRL